MASIALLVGGALVNALAFSGSNFLFSMLRDPGAGDERKRHDQANVLNVLTVGAVGSCKNIAVCAGRAGASGGKMARQQCFVCAPLIDLLEYLADEEATRTLLQP